jgi:hypothetical protein
MILKGLSSSHICLLNSRHDQLRCSTIRLVPLGCFSGISSSVFLHHQTCFSPVFSTMWSVRITGKIPGTTVLRIILNVLSQPSYPAFSRPMDRQPMTFLLKKTNSYEAQTLIPYIFPLVIFLIKICYMCFQRYLQCDKELVSILLRISKYSIFEKQFFLFIVRYVMNTTSYHCNIRK